MQMVVSTKASSKIIKGKDYFDVVLVVDIFVCWLYFWFYISFIYCTCHVLGMEKAS